MPLTPNSSSSSYLTPADFLLLRDVQTTGDLVNDNGQQVDPATLLNDPVLAKALSVASGLFEVACVAGGRYSPADLQALMLAGGNGAAFVEGVIADIAAFELSKRRWAFAGDTSTAYEQAVAILSMLRNGESVLPFVEAENAGVADTNTMTPSDVYRLGLMTSNSRIFGLSSSQNRTPYGGWGAGGGNGNGGGWFQ